MNIALCHEWLAGRAGSEKTFEEMARALPDADLYALTRDPAVPFDFGGRPVHTTFLDRVGGGGKVRDRRDLLLPLMPLAWRYATRRRYDLVITSSHACAKGFRPARRALHLCYCYTPMRYVWLASVDARRSRSPLTALPEAVLRAWDRRSATWVDSFAAISETVRERIERFYRRPATVIHPPVDTDFYTPDPAVTREDFALVVSRLIPYKRVDLAVEACAAAGLPLVVAGSGPEEGRLRDLSARRGATVTFVIGPDDQALRHLYRTARVVVFPALEDFGIVPVEAQACGTPVVALDAGGSRETVVDGGTGALVAHQDADELVAGLAAALPRVLAEPPTPNACRAHAEHFSTQRFRARFCDWVAAETAGSHAAGRGTGR